MDVRGRVVVLDIDGVACEHAKAICEWVAHEHGVTSTADDVTTWDHDFGPLTFVQAVESCYQNKDFIMEMEVTPGFHIFLNELSQIAKVFFASGRKLNRGYTRLWVQRNFGDFEIFFSKRKADLPCNYIVDDYPLEIEAGVQAGKTCFLFKRPWNDHENIKAELRQMNCAYFVESFDQILALLAQI